MPDIALNFKSFALLKFHITLVVIAVIFCLHKVHATRSCSVKPRLSVIFRSAALFYPSESGPILNHFVLAAGLSVLESCHLLFLAVLSFIIDNMMSSKYSLDGSHP